MICIYLCHDFLLMHTQFYCFFSESFHIYENFHYVRCDCVEVKIFYLKSFNTKYYKEVFSWQQG